MGSTYFFCSEGLLEVGVLEKVRDGEYLLLLLGRPA